MLRTRGDALARIVKQPYADCDDSTPMWSHSATGPSSPLIGPNKDLFPMTTIVFWSGGTPSTNYEFEIVPPNRALPAFPGVYVLCRWYRPETPKALYVGEAENIAARLSAGPSNHDGLARALKAGITHIAVRHVPDRSHRLAIETHLRHRLAPPCNAQGTQNALGTMLGSLLGFGRPDGLA